MKEHVAALVASSRVVLFMKGSPDRPQCGFSARTVGVLDGLGVSYASVDVLQDPAIREGVKAFGDWPTIPQLYVDGEFVGGCDIVVEMAGDGSLAALLGIEAAQPVPQVIQTSAQQVADWLAAGVAFEFLDVRTPQEQSIASVGARPLTTDLFPEMEALPRDTRIAFLCHHGIRSQAAAEAFRTLGFRDLHNVVGGIDAWSLQVDPAVPRY